MPAPGGVNSNLFALLDDDDNDDDAPVQKAPAAKPAAKKQEDQPKKTEQRKGKGGDDRRPRGGKGDRDEHSSGAYDGADKPNKPADGEGRGKGNRRRYDGEGGERKGKGKGKGDRRGREFDRHVSGTGRGKGEQAREGRGRANWGQAGDQGTTEPAAEGAEKTDAPPAEEVVEPEEEENTMTMDEYMASLAGKGPVGGKLEERTIEDKDEGFKVNRKGEDEGLDVDLYGSIFHAYDGQDKNRDAKEEREGWVTADDVLNMKFADPNAGQGQMGGGGKGKGDRGDRRGGKGKSGGGKGGDRGAPRGGSRGGGGQAPRPAAQQQGKIELEDTNAFPSLA